MYCSTCLYWKGKDSRWDISSNCCIHLYVQLSNTKYCNDTKNTSRDFWSTQCFCVSVLRTRRALTYSTLTMSWFCVCVCVCVCVCRVGETKRGRQVVKESRNRPGAMSDQGSSSDYFTHAGSPALIGNYAMIWCEVARYTWYPGEISELHRLWTRWHRLHDHVEIICMISLEYVVVISLISKHMSSAE